MQIHRIKTGSSATDGYRGRLSGKRPEHGGSACYDNRRFLRTESGRSRVCLHVLTGRVDAPKICTREFECYHCGFDQLLDDMEIAGNAGPCVDGSGPALNQ